MSKKKPSPKKRSFLTNALIQIESLINDLSSALKFVAIRPFRELGLLKWSITGSSAVPSKKSSKFKSGWKSVVFFPFGLIAAAFAVFGKVLISPGEMLVGLGRGQRTRILWSLPGLLVLGIMVAVGMNQGWFGDTKSVKLKKAARVAFQDSDFETAANLYSEVEKLGSSIEANDALNWALAMRKIGDTEKATKLLQKLAPAPGNPPGIAPAHEVVALRLAMQLRKDGPNPLLLQSLRWHLENSGEARTAMMHNAWADYFIAIKDFDSALNHLEKAAEIKPEYAVLAADIYESRGNRMGQVGALKTALGLFTDLVKNEPKDPRHRMMLAKIYYSLEEFDQAESTLIEGIELTDNPNLKNALADFYLNRFRASKADFDERFELLQSSFRVVPTFLPSHDAIIQYYQIVDEEENKQKIKDLLADKIAIESSAGIAHFALSNIYWLEEKKDLSLAHMEKAFSLDARLTVVANNLAWLLAGSDDPDLERAFDLSSRAVQREPENGNFRDTLGTILMKKEQYDEALIEFHKALRTMENKKTVHQKMATIYESMNKLEFAKEHREKARTSD